MSLRVKRQAQSGARADLEAAADVEQLLNRNAELEILNANLKRLLDISRRRERKLVKALEDVNADSLLSLDLDECGADDVSATDSTQSFLRSLADRTGWLIGLLVFQSLSSFILKSNEDLLQRFPTIVYFLTMLVGAGGNAGNQATVRVIRGLALGSLTVKNSGWYVAKETAASLLIGLVVGVAGLMRVYYFSAVGWHESMAIALALVSIVVSSIVIGTVLPLLFQAVGVDPAHSSTTIQVIMDISGVLVTCLITSCLLDTSSSSGRLGRDLLEASRSLANATAAAASVPNVT
eukprot:gene9365-6708_t